VEATALAAFVTYIRAILLLDKGATLSGRIDGIGH